MKADVVGQLAHQKHATAAAFAKIFRLGRVWDTFVVKSISLIRDPDSDAIPFFSRPHLYGFGFLLTVAVNDGVRDGLCEADKNIALFVWVKVVPVNQFFNERFHC